MPQPRPVRRLARRPQHRATVHPGVGLLVLAAAGLTLAGAVVYRSPRPAALAAVVPVLPTARPTPRPARLAATTSGASPATPAVAFAPTAVSASPQAPTPAHARAPQPTAPYPWAEIWAEGNLRTAPTLDAAVIRIVPAGTAMQLLGWADDWWWIRDADGEGWVSETLLTFDPEAVAHVPFVVAAVPALPAALIINGGNLRQGPEVAAPIVGGVDAEDVLLVLAQDGDWLRVQSAETTAWLHASLAVVHPQGAQSIPTWQVAVAPAAPAVVAAAPAPVPPKTGPRPPVAAAPTAGKAPAPASAPQPQAPAAPKPAAPKPQAPVAVNPIAPQPQAPAAPKPAAPKPQIPAAPKPQIPSVPKPVVPVVPKPANPVAPKPAAGWPVADGPGNLIRLVDVNAPRPFIAPGAVASFNRVRSRILRASGVDYLGRLDEAFRSIGFQSSKPGVANRSWHKAGRAIDVVQWFKVGGRQGVVFIRDKNAGGLWRVLLRCARQDGSLGRWYTTAETQRRGPAAYYVDVTTIMTSEGWTRIYGYQNVTEAWHYEYRAGLTWRQAMRQLYSAGLVNRMFP